MTLGSQEGYGQGSAALSDCLIQERLHSEDGSSESPPTHVGHNGGYSVPADMVIEQGSPQFDCDGTEHSGREGTLPTLIFDEGTILILQLLTFAEKNGFTLLDQSQQECNAADAPVIERSSLVPLRLTENRIGEP